MGEQEGLGEMDAERLTAEGTFSSQDSRIEDYPGSPTWPIEATPEATGPEVGLNWTTVGKRLGVDPQILRHEGQIVLTGEYFPAAGFFIDPETFQAQHVDVGDRALRHGYFIGDLSAREFTEWLELAPPKVRTGLAVMRSEHAPIIALFKDERDAERSKTAILQGAVGGGIRVERSPLGVEMRVARAEQPGKTATIIAAHGGAIISIAGRETASHSAATAPVLPTAQADSWRPGTGAAADSEAPFADRGGSDEFSTM